MGVTIFKTTMMNVDSNKANESPIVCQQFNIQGVGRALLLFIHVEATIEVSHLGMHHHPLLVKVQHLQALQRRRTRHRHIRLTYSSHQEKQNRIVSINS